MSNSQKVLTFLQDLEFSNGEKFQIVEKLLEICLSVYQNLITDIKYGGIIIMLQNKHVCGIFVYKNHVTLEFSNGYLLKDPEKILQGNGQFRRHLKFEKYDDIVTQNSSFFIKQLLLLLE